MPNVNYTTLNCWQCSKRLTRDQINHVADQIVDDDFNMIVDRIRYYCNSCFKPTVSQSYDDPFDQ